MKNIYKCLKTKHFNIKIGGKNFPGKIVNIQVLLLRSLSTHPNNQGKSDARFNEKVQFSSQKYLSDIVLNVIRTLKSPRKILREYVFSNEITPKITAKLWKIICMRFMSSFSTICQHLRLQDL